MAGPGVRAAVVATAVSLRSGFARACPACDDPGAPDRGVDTVTALLVAGSLFLVIRELARRLLRRLARPRADTLPSTESNNPP